ncbi:MAG TPA: CoA transferase [Acidimicrobiales bacterium]|nr:CoA transferase [Acidimicrobiales bacterium]
MDALDGVRILDLTWGIAGPAGILLLAEHGADVTKVEPPGGDPYRAYPGYRVWNRSRRSVTLDLKSVEGKERFLELVSSADVLAEAFSPGVMARLGLDYPSLEQRFPELVYVSVPAYPADSRHASRAGWDALVQARSGQQYEQPCWRSGPAFLASPMPSMGALYLVPAAILAALHARERTGRGQFVETSLYQGVLATTTMLWVHAQRNQNQLQSMMTKTYPPGIHQPEVIECADGWIQSLAGATQKKGVMIHDVVGIPKDTPPDKVYEALAENYRTRKREELVTLLHEQLFQVAEILPTRETLQHPQIVANHMAVTVEDPEVGRTVQVGMPFKLSRTPARDPRPRPLPGQHNDEVLRDVRPRPARGAPASAPPRYPLDGIRVLDFGRAFAGPFAPMVLAGLGADVIKVATTEGDTMAAMMSSSSVWLGCEQGKRSIRVDLKTSEGAEVVRKLVERSDVVHHNMTKGVAQRLGIDHESLRAIKPDIISCNTYMYGPEGPLSHLGGNDSLAQALSGLEWEAGPAEEGNRPLWYRFGHGDTANALSSVVGVLVALAHRDRTGEGQAVWTSLLNAATYLCSEVHLTEDGASEPPKLDRGQTGFGALYRLYESQEGWVQVAAVKEEHWPAFCRAIGQADLEADPRFATARARQDHREELEALLEPVFLTQTALQWRRRLDDAGVPAEISVSTVDGETVLFDEENVRLGLVAETEHLELGRLRQVGRLIRFSGTPSTVLRPPPVPGQHTTEIMAWLGYDEPTIADYSARGIIAG